MEVSVYFANGMCETYIESSKMSRDEVISKYTNIYKDTEIEIEIEEIDNEE